MLRKLNQFDRRKLRVRRELAGNSSGRAAACPCTAPPGTSMRR